MIAQKNYVCFFNLIVLTVLQCILFEPCWCFAVGITPEQIYQADIDQQKLLGTWEKLPEVNPLSEAPGRNSNQGFRTLMTLRKDGTCRIFDSSNPSGTDGIWTYKDHGISITLSQATHLEFFIYGIKDDFMVTRSPINRGTDQLWSRVK